MIWFFAIFILFIVGCAMYSSKFKAKQLEEQSKTKNQLLSLLKEYDNKVDEEDYIFNYSYDQLMSLNNHKRILYFVNVSGEVTPYEFKDILEAHIVEDDISITKTSRGSQIGGALLGGILVGGIGAIIGGLSSKKKTTNEVKKIELDILLNDMKNPLKKFVFFQHLKGIKTNDDRYIFARDNVEKWYNKFKVIIHRQDQKDEKINA